MQMYGQSKLNIKHKYTEAIEESQNDNNANDGSRPLLMQYGEEILPTCQRATRQWF